jgi:5-methylcytosine-specific restriction protein A
LVPSGQKRCPAHTEPTALGWRQDETRIRGRKLQKLRKALFQREPLCRVCKAEGRVTLATIRDHIVPLAEGGTDDDTNIQPLCRAHSDVKTQREAQRGRS